MYNRDNVLLVDVKKAPIQCITPTGLRTADAEYELDVIIFATGYDAVTGSLNRIDIRGIGGELLRDKFANGPRTYMGIQSNGFPNMFTINAASVGNFVRAAEPLVDVGDRVHPLREGERIRPHIPDAGGRGRLGHPRKRGRFQDSPIPGRFVVRGGQHSRQGAGTADQSGHGPGNAGQAGRRGCQWV